MVLVDMGSLMKVADRRIFNMNAAQTVRSVDSRHFSLNAAIWDSVFDTANTIGLLTGMNNQALRFPGGSLSDDYHWASTTTGTNT